MQLRSTGRRRSLIGALLAGMSVLLADLLSPAPRDLNWLED
jgi:hypothetical protein